jgi:hypothetical protein
MKRWVQGSLSLMVLMAVAGSARADGVWFGLRNDTGVPIMVQTGVVAEGGVVLGRPLVLLPGEVSWDNSVKPCVKFVAFANPKNPKMILFKTTVNCGPDDVFMSVKMPGANQFRLIPATPPPKRPGQ